MNRTIEQKLAEIEELCRSHHVLRLDLFGSAATGTDRQGESDLDFLVEFDQDQPGSYSDAYFGLLESLEQLFDRKVDLVVGSAIKNPYFRESVERTKASIYAA